MISDEINFIFREAARQMRRERLIAIATISTVAVLLLVLGALVLFYLNLSLWTGRIAQELEVWAYFAKDVPRAEAERTAAQVGQWAEVASAEFVPKEEGMKKLRTYLPGSSALRGLGNPLPDGVRIRVRDPRLVPAVAWRLAGLPGIKDVLPTPLVERVIKVKRAITWAGGIIAALVTVAGVFIVHNTVRLALHSRWREIYIMQLVGATRTFVAAPFIVEGLVHGFLGAAAACCLLIPAHMYLRSLSARAAPFFLLMPDRAMLSFGLCLLLTGALLGLTGSIVSVRRFLLRRPDWHT